MNPLASFALVSSALAFFTYTMLGRGRVLFAVKPVDRFDHVPERLAALLAFGFGQKRMVDREERTTGAMHVLIFAAFMTLALRTLMLVLMGFSEGAFHLLTNPAHSFWADHALLKALFEAYLLAKDVVAVGALAGVLYFFYLRLVVQPDRLTKSGEALLILGFIGGLMVTEFLFGAAHLLHEGRPFYAPEPVTSLVAEALRPLALSQGALSVLAGFGFWTHLVIIFVFLNFLPYGKHFHIITGLPNVFFKRLTPSGELRTADLEKEDFGARTVKDLHWKNILDVYSCTECGRCQTHCPTYLTDKPLSHKQVNQDIKRWTWDNQEALVTGKTKDGKDFEVPGIIGTILKAETVWACTTCGWCETACPVFIENVPRLVEMRRQKVQVEADFPPEAQRVFEGMERQGNPWGIGQDKRDEWASDLALPTWGDGGGPYEYLFFVGCAGSYDDRMKKVSRSMVRILNEAGIKFATLSKQEACTGDPARRLGNEYLFQTLAKTNVETLNSLGVKAVITQCPHCFNTIKNEYPDFGGNYEVWNHTEFINHLLKTGRIKLGKVMNEKLTYHDPCYLGRHNGVYDAPREALAAIPGLQVVEMQRSKRESFCCGAGGGRMWLEEHEGSRINHARVNEIALTLQHDKDPSTPFPSATDKKKPGQVGAYTGPSAPGTVAVACPFCHTMVRDGLSDTGREEQVKVKDVAELVADALEPAPPKTVA